MSEDTKQKVIERLIGLGSTAIVALLTFLIASFASDKDLQAVSIKADQAIEKAEEVEISLGSYARKEEVNQVEKKIDNVLTALCIMETKTCKLKDVR